MKFITRIEREKSKIEFYRKEETSKKNLTYLHHLINELSEKDIYKNRNWYEKQKSSTKNESL